MILIWRNHRILCRLFSRYHLMAEFTLEEKDMRRMLDLSIREWARVAVDLIVQQTPRDRKRPPKPLGVVGESKPSWRIVTRWGYYYPAVTWNLKASIWFEKSWSAQYDVWVRKWPASSYARIQEFGWYNVPARPYIRKGFAEWVKEIMQAILLTFRKLSSSWP
jgi:hypothetical protein